MKKEIKDMPPIPIKVKCPKCFVEYDPKIGECPECKRKRQSPSSRRID